MATVTSTFAADSDVDDLDEKNSSSHGSQAEALELKEDHSPNEMSGITLVSLSVPFVTLYYSTSSIVTKFSITVGYHDSRGYQQTCVELRYSEIRTLHARLREKYMQNISLSSRLHLLTNTSDVPSFPAFPSRKFFADTNRSISAVIARRTQLHRYFSEIILGSNYFLAHGAHNILVDALQLRGTSNGEGARGVNFGTHYTTRDGVDGFLEVVGRAYSVAYFRAPDRLRECKNKEWIRLAQVDSLKVSAMARIPTVAIALTSAKVSFDALDPSQLLVLIRCERSETRDFMQKRFAELVAFYKYIADSKSDYFPEIADARRFFYRYREKNNSTPIQDCVSSASRLRREDLQECDGKPDVALVRLHLSQARRQGASRKDLFVAERCINSRHYTVSREEIADSAADTISPEASRDDTSCVCTNRSFCASTGINVYKCQSGIDIMVFPPHPK